VGDAAESARAIENLVYAYAEAIDAGDLQAVGELFRHGVLHPAPGLELTGVDEVRKLYEGTTRLYEDGTPKSHHVTTNVAVEVDEASGAGTARSYYTVFQQTDALPLQPIIAGRYEDTFHRVEGEWWFASRRMFVTLKGDLSQHLTFDL
jgi:3-phenylpropionate/cinnamic acid dioxygenase small subunit